MRNKIIIFAIGLVLGAAMIMILDSGNKIANDVRYIRLKNDYHISDIGRLNKGTILKIDKGMSEGFTRYILYLNLKYDEVDEYKTGNKNEIMPYWLIPDTTK